MRFLIGAYAAAIAALMGVFPALADWPERPVTLVVSQGAGASPDIMARLLAEKLSAKLGTRFIVDNRPGGGNVVGSASVARSAPDGYTLFFATSAALVTNPYVMKNLPYDPLKSFDPAALVATSQILIVANPASGITSVKSLIEKSKAGPVVSVGVDSPRNLSGIIARAINHEAGIQLRLVSYNNIPQSVQDTVSGVIPVSIQSESVVTPYLKDNSLKAIAVAGSEGIEMLPDLPTVTSVLPGVDLKGWFMIVTPKGVDPAIIDKLNAAVRAVIAEPEVQALAKRLGFQLSPGYDVAKSAAFLESQLKDWKAITANLGIVPE